MMHHKLTSKKMDYSHCPLKKRPVHFVKFEYIKEEMDYGKYKNIKIIRLFCYFVLLF